MKTYTMCAFTLEKGENGLALFNLVFIEQEPFVVQEFFQAERGEGAVLFPIDPTLLQRAGGADFEYFYQGQIVFQNPSAN